MSSTTSRPSAVIPSSALAVRVEREALRLPASPTKATPGWSSSTTASSASSGPSPALTVRILTSATVEARRASVSPAASVGGGWTRPFDVPVAETSARRPDSALPLASRSVIRITASLMPSATTPACGSIATEEAAGSTGEGDEPPSWQP